MLSSSLHQPCAIAIIFPEVEPGQNERAQPAHTHRKFGIRERDWPGLVAGVTFYQASGHECEQNRYFRSKKRLLLAQYASFGPKQQGSPEMAVRLSKVFGGTEEGWLVQQAQYDLAQVRRD